MLGGERLFWVLIWEPCLWKWEHFLWKNGRFNLFCGHESSNFSARAFGARVLDPCVYLAGYAARNGRFASPRVLHTLWKWEHFLWENDRFNFFWELESSIFSLAPSALAFKIPVYIWRDTRLEMAGSRVRVFYTRCGNGSTFCGKMVVLTFSGSLNPQIFSLARSALAF